MNFFLLNTKWGHRSRLLSNAKYFWTNFHECRLKKNKYIESIFRMHSESDFTYLHWKYTAGIFETKSGLNE